MSTRHDVFAPGEIYHCYNRGVDKRVVFQDQQDFTYFISMLRHYNTSEVFGNLKQLENRPAVEPPVTILSYCLLPNHYHLLLRCNDIEGGFSKYMQRLGGGYTMYFNNKNNRSGALFQGKFKSKLIEHDDHLRNIIAYIGHNNLVHDIYDTTLYRSGTNTKDELIKDLSLDFSEANRLEIIDIIKEVRHTRKDLELA
jgi:REP element-mobilizing transposase RayT